MRMNLTENKYTIDDGIMASLDRYAAHGTPTGGFLRAVLENDLRESFARADQFNRRNLFDIVRYCWNELPGDCWGSPERVAKWLDRKATERRNEQG